MMILKFWLFFIGYVHVSYTGSCTIVSDILPVIDDKFKLMYWFLFV